MAKVTLKAINAHIVAIGNGEQSFKKEMGEVSRDLLTYVSETGDIDAVNRLIDVLTPINRERARTYFTNFLPYTVEKGGRYGSKSKNKNLVEKKEKLCAEFLKAPQHNIWTWLVEKQGAPAVARPKEYEKKISQLVKRALTDKDEKERVEPAAVLRAIINGGVKLSDIMMALLPTGTEEHHAQERHGPPEQQQQPAA